MKTLHETCCRLDSALNTYTQKSLLNKMSTGDVLGTTGFHFEAENSGKGSCLLCLYLSAVMSIEAVFSRTGQM